MENSVEQTDLSRLEQWFTTSEDASQPARDESERARDYCDGKQITEEESSSLKRRKQPIVVNNRIRRKIEWLLGLEIKQRTDPKAFPRSPKHQEGAEAATDAVRYVCDNTDWDQKRTAVYDNMLVEGFGGVEVIHTQKRNGDIEIVVNQYPWDRLFYDPHSRMSDFSDCRYKGAVIWMDFAEFKMIYPKANLDEMIINQNEGSTDTYSDRPRNSWVDTERERVRVILMWYKDKGAWKFSKFIKGEELESGESPYVDEDGESECPLIMQSLYVGRNNDRYGVVRDMFDPQDEINKRRSKALHLINSRQTLSIKGAVGSTAKLKNELAKPDGHIEITSEALEEAARVGMKPFEILNTGDMAAAQFQLLQEAKSEIDLLGANSALEGETGESTSGRAVLARQQGGMIEITAMQDKLHRFTREVYRQIWNRVRQFWTEEKWVRVTDEEVGARFVGLNRPITLQEQLGNMPEEQAAMIARELGLRPGDPRLNQVVGIDNNVEEIDVDMVIEEVPDRVTLQGEAFEALLRYAQAGQIPSAVLIEADPSLPAKKKEKLLQMMQQPPAPSPKDQLDMAEQEAGVRKTQAETQKIEQEAYTAGMPLAGLA